MMKAQFKKTLLALPLASLFAGAVASADVIELKNGDRVTGTVVKISDGAMTLTSGYGEMVIPVDQISGIDAALPMRVTTPVGEEVLGTLTNDGGQQYLRTDSGLQPLSIADLNRVVDKDFTTDYWTNYLDFGLAVSKGNSETESISLHYDTNMVRGNTEHLGHAYWNTDEADGVTTRNQVDAGYSFRWYFRDSWYALGNLGYFKDELKEIDRRITVGAGLGHQFFANDIANFSTELGISQVFENLAGESESNPAVRWGMDYNRWLRPEQVQYFYGHEVLKILDSDRGEIYKINTGIRFNLSENWTANARVDLVHESKPPAGREKNDVVYSVGVGLAF
ncbi:MAG: YdiY family protein [Pseudomonadales bacterium]